MPAGEGAAFVLLIPGMRTRATAAPLLVAGLFGPAPLLFGVGLGRGLPVRSVALLLVGSAVGGIPVSALIACGLLFVELGERAQRVARVRDAFGWHLARAIGAGLMGCRQLERRAARLNFERG